MASTGTIYARTYDGTCWSAATVNSGAITINTVPSNPAGTISASDNPACGSSTLSYSSPSASIYWQTSTSGTSTASPTTSTYSLASTGTIYARFYNGTCWSAGTVNSGTITINTIPSNPAGTISSSASPACGSSTLTYSSPSASIYWQTASDGTSTASPTTSTYSLTSTGTIYARTYDGTCWSTGTANSGTVTITTLPSAPSSVTGSTPFCLDAATTLNATSAGNTIKWYDASTSGNLIATSSSGVNTTYTPLTAGDKIYYAETSTGASAGSQTYNSSTTFTVPAGVTSIEVHTWGGGGAGGSCGNGSATNSAAGGGAGGNYGFSTLTVTPGQNYTITVGNGGTPGAATASTNGGVGGQTSVTGTGGTVTANGGGGGGGAANNASGTAGTVGATGTATTTRLGGAAAAGGGGTYGPSGGGGGGAGSGSVGGAASGSTAGTGGTGTYTGGAGGAGRGTTLGANGTAGTATGGGGGGAQNYSTTGAYAGGAGGAGKVIITWTDQPGCSSATRTATNTITVDPKPLTSNLSASGATACAGAGATVTVSSTTLATGTYTVTYNVSGTNTVSSTTASMSFTAGSPGTGTFTTSTLATAGAANVVNITGIAFTSTSCSSAVTTPTAAFTTSNNITWTGTTSTNWNTASNWSCGIVPTSSSVVTIASATNQPAISAAAACNSITLNSGTTLTINSGFTLTASGNWTNNGATISGTGTVLFSGTTTIGGSSATTFPNVTTTGTVTNTVSGMTVTGTFSQTAGTFTANSPGTVAFTMNYNIFSLTGGTYNNQISGATLTGLVNTNNITGSYTQTATSTFTTLGAGVSKIIFNGGGNSTYSNAYTTAVTNFVYNNIQVSNNTTLTLSTDLILYGTSGTGQITVDAGSTLDAGTKLIKAGATLQTWYINGTIKTANTAGLSNTGASTLSSTNTPTSTLGSSSTVEYNASATQTVTNRIDYANVTLTGGSKTIGTSTGQPLTLSKTLTINSGATYLGSNWNNTLTVGGDFINSGTFTQGTALVTLNGSVAQNLNIGSSSFSNALTITNSSGGVSLLTNNLAVGGAFTLNGAGGFNANSLTNTVTGLATLTSGTYTAGSGSQTFNGGLTVSGGTFTGSTGAVSSTTVTISSGTLTAPSSSGSFTVTGNWSLTSGATFTHNDGTVTFNGTTTVSGTGATSFNNVTINSTKTLTGMASTTGMNVSGNWVNDGTFTHNSGLVTFNGNNALQTISGGATTTFNNLTVNKGTSVSNILEATSVIGMLAGGLTLTNGTLKVSSASTFTTNTNTNLTLSATTGLNINNSSASITVGSSGGNLLVSGGQLSLNSGTLTVGNGGSRIDVSSGNADFTSGTVNINGRFNLTGGTTTITGASINLDPQVAGGTVGATTDIFQATGAANLTFSSGTLTIIDPHALTGTGNAIQFVSGAGTKNFSGSTIRLGDGTSTTSGSVDGFDINTGGITLGNLIINNPSGTNRTSFLKTNNLIIGGDFTLTAGTFDANGLTSTIPNLVTVPAGATYLAKTATQTLNGGLTVSGGTFTGAAGTVTTTNMTLSGGTLTAPSGTFNVSGNWSNSGGTFTHNSGIVTFTSTASGKTIAGSLTGSNKFFDIVFNGSGGGWTFSDNAEAADDFTITNGSVTAPAALTIKGSYSNSGTFTNNSGLVTFNATTTGKTIAGTLTSTSKFFGVTFNGTGGAWAFSDNADVADDFTITAGSVTAPSGTLNIAKNFSNSGTFTHNSGTVVFNGITQSVTGATTFNNLTHSGASAQTLTLNSATTVAGNVTNSDGTLALNNVNLTIGGNYANSVGSGFTPGSGSVIFNKASGTQTLLMTTGGDFSNIQHTGAGTLQLSSDLAMTGNLTNSAGTFDVNIYNIVIAGNWTNSATFLPGTGATYVALNGSSGTQTIDNGSSQFNDIQVIGAAEVTMTTPAQSFGDVIVNGPLSTTAQLVLIGGDAQSITSTYYTGGTPIPFQNLTINKTAGVAVTLTKPVRVTGTLTMTQGDVVTDATNILEVGTSASSVGSVTWTAGTVRGPMKRWFAAGTNSSPASGIFPVGGNIATTNPWTGAPKGVMNRYVQVNFTTAPSTGGYIIAKYVVGNPGLTTGLPIWTPTQYIQNFEEEGYWDITPYSAAGVAYAAMNSTPYTLKLRLNMPSTNDGSYITAPERIRIISSKGPDHNTWVVAGAQGAGQSQTSTGDYLLEETGVTGFSWFNGGGDNFNPLPVELLSFSGLCEEGIINLTWQTASEFNSSHFDVEKSRDGENWQLLTTLPSAGTSNELITYQSTDQNGTDGNNYFRLRQVDNDGKEKLYDPINVSCIETTAGYFSSFPNPSGSSFQVIVNNKEILGACTLNIVDAQGKVVDQRSIEVKDGINMFVISETLNPGIYFLNITNGTKSTPVLRHAIN